MILKIYKKKEKKDGTRQIELSVSYKGQRVQTGLGVSLCDNDFEQVEKAIKGVRCKLSDNARLAVERYRAIEGECNKIELGVESGFIKEKSVDVLAVINRCKGVEDSKQERGSNLSQLFTDFVIEKQRTDNLGKSTMGNYGCVLSLLKEYRKGIGEISTEKGIEKFSQWLQHTKQLNNTSCVSYMAIVRLFLSWCHEGGLCGDGFTRAKGRLKLPDRREKAIIYLTKEEVKRIEKLELTGVVDEVRDIFLFQCYTGLRVSDVRLLKWEQVGGDTIRYTTKKTDTFVSKKLPKQAVEILNKHRGSNVVGGRVFNLYSNPTMGIRLKEIGMLAEIDEPVQVTEYRDGQRKTISVPKWQKLTTHVGRKTFVVLSLSMGFTANQVIKETGHATINSLLPYIDITDRSRNEIADRWSEEME